MAVPIFTFPRNPLNELSNIDLTKILTYYNIKLPKDITKSVSLDTREIIMNMIRGLHYTQRIFIMAHRIDIGGYYIPIKDCYFDSFIKQPSITNHEIYILTISTKTYELLYCNDEREWKFKYPNKNLPCIDIKDLIELRKSILFIENLKHLYNMTTYLLDNHILIKDIVTHIRTVNINSHIFI